MSDSETDVEYITIIEGPTPDFRPVGDLQFQSIFEGPDEAMTLYCELRTMNGEDIMDRCRRAWREARPVRLDFPDNMRMRQEMDVVSLRLQEVDQGSVLQLWLRQPVEEIEELIEKIDDEFDDDDFDDDDGDLGIF